MPTSHNPGSEGINAAKSTAPSMEATVTAEVEEMLWSSLSMRWRRRLELRPSKAAHDLVPSGSAVISGPSTHSRGFRPRTSELMLPCHA